MLNARKIDSKFYISGGWQHIERDTEWLKTENIRAVLDLQYTPWDEKNVPEHVKDYLEDNDIAYHYIIMEDGWDSNLSSLFEAGETMLAYWDSLFSNRKDRILIKCGAGVSRSVSQYLNYICKRDEIPFQEAYRDYRNKEDKWANIYAEENYWPGMPTIEFVQFLDKKYPSEKKSLFGEVE